MRGVNDTHLSELLAEAGGDCPLALQRAAAAAGAPAWNARAVAVPPPTASGGSAKPKRGCSCNWMGVPTPGWKSGDHA